MYLFKLSLKNRKSLAFIVDLPDQATSFGVSTAAFDNMTFVTRFSGRRALWFLIAQALQDDSIEAVAVSLNSDCVFDDELPMRLEKACIEAAGGADWSVLAATGKFSNGMVASVVYPSKTPRMFGMNIPQPILDCGLELFILNAAFLRANTAAFMSDGIPPESFAQWCILTGYLEGRLSIFRPELAIGVNGFERGRDLQKHTIVMRAAFEDHLADDQVPSLMGDISLVEINQDLESNKEENGRDRASVRPMLSLTDMVRRLVQPVSTRMSLSVITRTQFAREYLLRRMLSTMTRARLQRDLELEIILSTDIVEKDARCAFEKLQSDFPELDLVLQVNTGCYRHSRVDNLMGGIFSACKDYIAIVDDDDYIDLDAFKAISTSRFLGQDPLLLMHSQLRNEVWRETGEGRWILEGSTLEKTYYSDSYRLMFSGSNQLPVCAMVAPRSWMQDRLRDIELRHDLSEDYTIYLALLNAPDRPPIMTCSDIFCVISLRNDNSNTVTMKDRRPWVRDITLFLHDLFVADPIPNAGVMQILSQCAHVGSDPGIQHLERSASFEPSRQAREIALLKAEIAHLRSTIINKEAG